MGHLATNGGIQGHSAGPHLPHLCYGLGTTDEWVLQRPDGTVFHSTLPCKAVHALADYVAMLYKEDDSRYEDFVEAYFVPKGTIKRELMVNYIVAFDEIDSSVLHGVQKGDILTLGSTTQWGIEMGVLSKCHFSTLSNIISEDLEWAEQDTALVFHGDMAFYVSDTDDWEFRGIWTEDEHAHEFTLIGETKYTIKEF